MSDPLTRERIEELRRIAEAATPGPWRISDDGPADRFVIASADREHIAETTQGGSFTNEDLANAHHISTFAPPTVLAMLYEIERLQRIESAAKRVRATHSYDHRRVAGLCDCSLCEMNATLACNAQLRELLDRHQWSADGCPECGEFESDGHVDWCEIAAALASSPANPYAEVVEAARRRKAARDENAIAWTPESVQVVDEAADDLDRTVANLRRKEGASCDL